MISYAKEKYVRNAVLLALVACLVSLALGANAQNIVPPGFYGWGWGDQPYWLKPTFDYSYETQTGHSNTVCMNEDQPVYSRSNPPRYLGVKSVYVCKPDDAFGNQ
jgi:hypothetical protein